MNIMGISAFYHDAAACLVQNGHLRAAVSEERFSRVKNDPRLPIQAFRFCLETSGLDITDLDAIAYYEMPHAKLARQLWASPADMLEGDGTLLDPHRPLKALRERLGFQGPILCFPHHESHAASTFFLSGFSRAAIMTVDGVGEWATTSYGVGDSDGLSLLEQVQFPHSLGLFYASLTAYLGFRINEGEYKVMGLAPYGDDSLVPLIRKLVSTGPGGSYQLDMSYFNFVTGREMYAPGICTLLGRDARVAGEALQAFHRNVAKAAQLVLEELLLEKANWLHQETGLDQLCMAGGVALNCVANGRILKQSPFKQLFVQPAAGDAGSCVGAALLAHARLSGQLTTARLDHVFLGPAFSTDQIHTLLRTTGLAFLDFRGREHALLTLAAELLRDNKVLGWFQGAMEFGPRALGARSILANPLDPQARDRLNHMVKKRESFRPFAPSVLAHHANQHFDLDHPSPFMLQTCQVISPLKLPGITHVDGSARPQTVDRRQNRRFAALLETFYTLSGCPMLVNTSFNVADEPIVCTPADALACMALAGLDGLFLGDFYIDGRDLPTTLPALLAQVRSKRQSSFKGERNALQENLYTFV